MSVPFIGALDPDLVASLERNPIDEDAVVTIPRREFRFLINRLYAAERLDRELNRARDEREALVRVIARLGGAGAKPL